MPSKNVPRDKVIGCIVGGAIGDAMGTPYEGLPGPVEIDQTLPWAISDDTQLTLATCEAIAEVGRVDPETIARHFVAWFRAGRITGVGASTLKALQDLSAGVPWALAGGRGEYGAGNGAAMRIGPVALSLDPDDPSYGQVLGDVCRITHLNDEAYAGALAVTVAEHAAGTSQWSPGMDLLGVVADNLPDTTVRDRLLEMIALPPNIGIDEVAARFGTGGYVVESVPLALFIVEKSRTDDFQSVIRSCIRVGGDTDTIASMAGQVLGTSLGYSALPDHLIERLPSREDIVAVASRFAGSL